jgi:hypothetical protein
MDFNPFESNSLSIRYKSKCIKILKKPITLLVTVLTFCIIYGCSSVQIYSDSNQKNKTGLKFYNVKPYILVELKSEKDLTVKTSVIYLPDLANPQYLIVKPGMGSNELKMAFTNGMLNSYGLTSDSKVAETITSLAGLISKIPDVVNKMAVAPSGQQQSASQPDFILYEVLISPEGTRLKRVESD